MTQGPRHPPPNGVTTLEFLCADLAAPDLAPAGAAWRSPLERALRNAPPGIEDISFTGKIEVRGDLDELEPDGFELMRITPSRALALCPFERTGEVRGRLRQQVPAVFDMTGALAGLRVRDETVMRRICDLDLDDLPAVGPVAGVQAYVLRDEDGAFRLFFAQEYGHYVAEVVVDAAGGLTP